MPKRGSAISKTPTTGNAPSDEVVVESNTTTVVSEEPRVTLTLVDLNLVVAVLDYAADQGAFKGWGTIRQVLELRDKMAAFVQKAANSTTETSNK